MSKSLSSRIRCVSQAFGRSVGDHLPPSVLRTGGSPVGHEGKGSRTGFFNFSETRNPVRLSCEGVDGSLEIFVERT